MQRSQNVSYPEWEVVFLQNTGISKERRNSGMLDSETSNQVKDGWDGAVHVSL